MGVSCRLPRSVLCSVSLCLLILLSTQDASAENATPAGNESCTKCVYSSADDNCTRAGTADTEETNVGMEVLNWALIFLLIALSGLFSGLTLGLLGLDKLGIEVRTRESGRMAAGRGSVKRLAQCRVRQ